MKTAQALGMKTAQALGTKTIQAVGAPCPASGTWVSVPAIPPSPFNLVILRGRRRILRSRRRIRFSFLPLHFLLSSPEGICFCRCRCVLSFRLRHTSKAVISTEARSAERRNPLLYPHHLPAHTSRCFFIVILRRTGSPRSALAHRGRQAEDLLLLLLSPNTSPSPPTRSIRLRLRTVDRRIQLVRFRHLDPMVCRRHHKSRRVCNSDPSAQSTVRLHLRRAMS
jgi:hypothetical protein